MRNSHTGTYSGLLRKQISCPFTSQGVLPNHSALLPDRTERGLSTTTANGAILFPNIQMLLPADSVEAASVTKMSAMTSSTSNTLQMNNWCLYRLCGFKNISRFGCCYPCCSFLSLPLQPVSHAQYHLFTRNKGRKNKSRSPDQKSEKWAVIKNKENYFIMQFLLWCSFFFFFKENIQFFRGQIQLRQCIDKAAQIIDKLCRGSFSKGREKTVMDIFCLGGHKFLNN